MIKKKWVLKIFQFDFLSIPTSNNSNQIKIILIFNKITHLTRNIMTNKYNCFINSIASLKQKHLPYRFKFFVSNKKFSNEWKQKFMKRLIRIVVTPHFCQFIDFLFFIFFIFARLCWVFYISSDFCCQG